MQSLLKLASIPRAALRSGAVLAPQWHAASVYASTLSPFTRSFASDKKKGKKQQAAPVEEKKKSDSKIPINILAGSFTLCDSSVDGKDPEVLPDDQYPDWLWHMLVAIVVESDG